MDSYLKYKFNNEPLCPHCEFELENACDLELGQDEECTIECPHCEKEYKVIACWDVSYSTSKL